jgi:hypothetical protein
MRDWGENPVNSDCQRAEFEAYFPAPAICTSGGVVLFFCGRSHKMSECCCGGGACAHKAKSTDVAVQNGKGDAPRNIGAKFRKNFDGIAWSPRKPVRPGEKYVKTY